jgi:5-methylthioribose kinase
MADGEAAEHRDEALLRTSLASMGLIGPDEALVCEPLTGGVSSDIWKVTTSRGPIAVKQARAQLKVAAEWRAPVERNAFEVKWYRVAAAVVPEAVPRVLGEDRAAGLFAMTYLDPQRHPVWKEQLRDGHVDIAFAGEVGRRLAAIQSVAARDPSTAAEFATDTTFHAIRLEPYLEATGQRHPQIAATMMALSRETLATKRTLVHGDISPKNILSGPAGPVFLDAECAWYGDPAFDLAFCLKHLMLKCLWTPRARREFLASFDALASSYLDAVDWEPRDAVERRAARLLPALFLARADGKSPVEYLDEDQRARVRRVAIPLIATPVGRLADVRAPWAQEVGA